VPAHEPPAAGDVRRLKGRQRCREGFGSVEVCAIGAGAHRKLGVPVEEEGSPLILDRRRDRLGMAGARGLLAVRQAQQHSGYIGRGKRLRESVREPCRILRGHEIKARSGAPWFGLLSSGRH
jgi:hypothetical protein